MLGTRRIVGLHTSLRLSPNALTVRSPPAGTYGDITYTLRETTFYKGSFRNGDEIEFTTAGQSAACGTYLELDEEK